MAYAAPLAGFMTATLPISLWFGKFATDTLFMPAAAMGTIVMVARVWDGVSDPLAGYLSDRTHSRLGRRRSWMLAAILPMVLTLVALWSPPQALAGPALVLWMGAAYILWETASTIFIVPYGALGNELTPSYHERTRLFGWRHLVSALGYPLALGVVYFLRTSADQSALEGRATATLLAVAAGIFLAVTVLYAVRMLPEPSGPRRLGAESLRKGVADVFRNPHARLLLVVYMIEAFGMGSISFLTPYVLDDVIGAQEYLEVVLLCWVVPQFVLTPLWLRVARKIGKKPLWIAGMVVYAAGFGANLWLSEGSVALLVGIVLVLGIGGGVSTVIAPAVQADVIDWDELHTGERKEGAYTAIWNLIRKGGWGVAAGVGGLALGWAGYDGNAELQAPAVKTTILVFVGAVPAVAYLVGAVLMGRFSLNEREHAEVLRQIRERS